MFAEQPSRLDSEGLASIDDRAVDQLPTLRIISTVDHTRVFGSGQEERERGR